MPEWNSDKWLQSRKKEELFLFHAMLQPGFFLGGGGRLNPDNMGHVRSLGSRHSGCREGMLTKGITGNNT